jgi:hypothetical protein|tara:strand:+ start:207 stop:590 length:384 start_codon:yes stop_codon:yes gene_type:complete
MLLYQKPDISTNIIIVDSFYYKVLRLDKRVTKFPFIINTAPTNTGLIPKIAKVLPLELFIDLSGDTDENVNKRPRRDYNKIIPNRDLIHKSLNTRRNYPRERPVPRPAKGVPIIRKTADGGVNIVLN